MLSRSTGCRQKTLQARQSACRWITITTCLFIHVFICVFIFSLHCEGDKKMLAEAVACWHKKAHARRGSSFPLKGKLVLGRKATRQLVRLSPVSGRDFFLFRWKQKHRWQRETRRRLCEPWRSCRGCVAGPLYLTDLVSEGSYSPSDGKQQLPGKLIDTQILFAT